MKPRIALLTIITLLTAQNVLYAHHGGHNNKEDVSLLYRWELEIDGHQLVGNFLMAKEGNVFIQDAANKVWSVNYHKLSSVDKTYVDKEIERIEALNVSFKTKLPIITYSRWNINFIAILVAIGAAITTLFVLGLKVTKANAGPIVKLSILLLFFCCVSALFIACKKESIVVTIAKTDPTFLDKVFEPFKPSVTTHWDNTYFYVESNGIPAHNMMVGIKSWQQQVPTIQPYFGSNAWSIPLQPEYADNPLSLGSNLMKGAVAIAANGIPIFNPLNNRGDDAYLFGELDNWGGHCGKADDYHYHIAPLHLQTITGNNPIAIALDGFSIYGSTEPDGSTIKALDTNNGHEYKGIYHYHGTSQYPYLIGAMKGKVSLDPNTTAPENQIIPQALTTAFRPAGVPLQGATITDFVSTGANAYKLTYQLNGKFGYLSYSWDSNGNYTFVATDINGNTTSSTYKR